MEFLLSNIGNINQSNEIRLLSRRILYAMFFLATRWNSGHCASRILFIKSTRKRKRVHGEAKLCLRFITTVMLGKDCYRRYLSVSITKVHALRSCARANAPRLTPSLFRIFRLLKLKASHRRFCHIVM